MADGGQGLMHTYLSACL